MSRFTFKKNERLCSLKAIDELYTSGQNFYTPVFKVIYKLQSEAFTPPCKIVFSVPKRSFKRAVDRNLIKRRIREAYRNNKHNVYTHLTESKTYLHVLFIYTSKKILSYEEITSGVQQNLQGLINKTGGNS